MRVRFGVIGKDKEEDRKEEDREEEDVVEGILIFLSICRFIERIEPGVGM